MAKIYRNIAIIAHVDHGKTTLVDAMLGQSGTFRENEAVTVRVMDSFDQERERGITIYAKNTAIMWNDTKINIVDTPGHADFGSEVERALRMVDGAVLLVDAYEGPMPQTKFVLKKALSLGLKPIVVINKIDKPTSRPEDVINLVFDLFVELGATDEQLDFPIVYAIAREGKAYYEVGDASEDLAPLFETIMKHVSPSASDSEAPFSMQIANLAYDTYVGRMGIGKVYTGTVKTGQSVVISDNEGKMRNGKIAQIFTTLGLKRVPTDAGEAGDIITVAGISDIYVGETIMGNDKVTPLPLIKIDAPTLRMEFLVNDSPFAGRDGKYLTSRHLRERLTKELEVNVGLQVEFDGEENHFMVSGRGELHLGVLLETMRREGFELQVGPPQVIFKEEGKKKMEPMELVVVSVPESMAGTAIEKLGKRKGIMKDMKNEGGNTIMEFLVPTRGLLGFRGEFLVDTKGEGIVYSSFSHYEEYKGPIEKREAGSMISGCGGVAMAYSLWNLEARGPLFIEPTVEVYEGMIIGESLKGGDLTVNPTKNKQLTNMRASGTDEAIRLTSIHKMTLEDALEYIQQDEYVEITPKTIRLRKKYLTENDRKKNTRAKD